MDVQALSLRVFAGHGGAGFEPFYTQSMIRTKRNGTELAREGGVRRRGGVHGLPSHPDDLIHLKVNQSAPP